MQITKETIINVAKSSCINLTDKEVEQFLVDFNSILDAFSKISEVNTKDVQPAFHSIEISDVTREDSAGKGCTQEQALSLSKHTSRGLFVGPKIL
ncbi:MAG: Asp-tRNA(Asn)/Glu-tRNA(Gln) amidotransferase subunit GatC [Candidatus Aenigmarchaeota archaeon]|nr:Asp-tRNA(Asn)/Glu-tRNA(Gln) amidotransferase subunit GatC [Candidatus Aenigmarchaeota archaeon]